MLIIKNIEKKYGKKQVLKNITTYLSDEVGIYGLLGRNGAGKTTLLKMICNQIPIKTGDILINNESVKGFTNLHTTYCLVGNGLSTKNDLLNRKIAELFTSMEIVYDDFDRPYAEYLLNQFNLQPHLKYTKLSKGNKTVVENIIGLASRSAVTIFDEPTAGLDSVNRERFFKELMEDYEKHPRLFIISTHLIDEVENYLTHVLMLIDGQIKMNAPIENIQSKALRITGLEQVEGRILSQSHFMGKPSYDVFTSYTDEELQTMEENGATITRLSLQQLFNRMVEREDLYV
ncbi:ATP-binding cassette domain-containing protein [Atopobacter phocae]|uniref:ATP-binding cassette domain-containing protein n=1 Tax=Atopobacter phocae TaxID=136492 RepID=UPI00047083AE|nr:ATP-binding cassette domain-containing protein [Atopobacter phocae]